MNFPFFNSISVSNKFLIFFNRYQYFSTSSSCFNTMCYTQRRKPQNLWKLVRNRTNHSLILLMNMFKDQILWRISKSLVSAFPLYMFKLQKGTKVRTLQTRSYCLNISLMYHYHRNNKCKHIS